MLIAGHENNGRIDGSALLLLRSTEQMNLLTLQPELIKQQLRSSAYDGPVHRTTIRTTAEDVEIGGVNIRGPVFVHLHRGINRDASRFPDPNCFDILGSFAESGLGYGAHFCLGLHLAGLKRKPAVSRALKLSGDAPGLRAGRYSWAKTVVRGPARLPVLLGR